MSLDAFLADIAAIPHVADEATLRRRSRDNSVISPMLRKALEGRTAEVIVRPEDRDQLTRTLSAAARHRVPITARGGGTANYGQSVPLKGGVLLDMTALSGIVWSRPGIVRLAAGTLAGAADKALRPTGWELRIHPSTRDAATVGGFVAGGSAGMGSAAWGMLRDRGNIIAAEVMSVEETPRVIELVGRDVELVHHAYGTNGIITELELPTAPALPWRELVVAFPDSDRLLGFGHQLGTDLGIAKKLISLHEWPIPRLMRRMSPLVPDGHGMALLMIAEPSLRIAADLVEEFGGTIVSDAAEGQGPYVQPIYEFAFGHGLNQIQKSDSRYTGVQAMVPAEGVLDTLARVRARLNGAPLRLEMYRSRGGLVAMGSPVVLYESEAQMAALVEMLQGEGVDIANSHASSVRAVGIKRITARDAELKRAMDPHNILNPGKFDFDDVETPAIGAALGTVGWSGERRAG